MPRGNGTTRQVPLKDLVRDPRLQSRAGGLNEDHAADLAEYLKDRKKNLPKVQVRKVIDPEGGDPILYVSDGFHTVEAHERAGRKVVSCNIFNATWEEALAAAASANQQHKGLKRTRDDKRRAVAMAREAFPKWSARQIAEHVGVSHTFVNDILAPKSGNVSTPAKPVAGRKPNAGEQVAEKTGDWRDVPCQDFLKASDFVWAALAAENINTAGDLDTKLSLLDVTHTVKADLRGELEALKEANGELPAGGEIGPQTRSQTPFADLSRELADGHATTQATKNLIDALPTPAPIQGAERFNWRDLDAAFAVVAKAPDRLKAAYPEKVFENQHAGAIRLLEELAEWLKGVRNRIQESEGK
jgi:hypothetical protein